MNKYDLIVVGTGFASTFFLYQFLELRPKTRVLVLERGNLETHAWKIQNRHLMEPNGVTSATSFADTYNNLTPNKPWVYTPSVGGSSNCWYGCTPRFLPADFKLLSTYGRGYDWPLSYNELEPFYCTAEELMAIAGPSDHSPFPRSRPYPQPAHTVNDVDRALMKAYPNSYFVMPAARPTIATAKRGRCCASNSCNLCPADAKFTVLNEMLDLYQRENVTLTPGAQVVGVSIEGGVCRSVEYLLNGEEFKAAADLVALGANPLFNAHILLNSGVVNPWLGSGLSEQVAFSCTLLLDGINNFSGSTVATGHGYMLYDGEHRRDYAACLIENLNEPRLRLEPGKYTQKAFLKFIFEDLPLAENRVSVSSDRALPNVEFHKFSEYLQAGIDNAKSSLEKLFSCLPVERIESHPLHPTEGHIVGTARMGESIDNSVVDKHQIVHNVRNLLSLGGSSFPSVSPANPTLTISALSLWTAKNIA